jgi:hypothetical protein
MLVEFAEDYAFEGVFGRPECTLKGSPAGFYCFHPNSPSLIDFDHWAGIFEPQAWDHCVDEILCWTRTLRVVGAKTHLLVSTPYSTEFGAASAPLQKLRPSLERQWTRSRAVLIIKSR